MMDAASTARYPSVWRKPPFIANGALRWAIYTGALLYVVIAIGAIDVNWARLSEGAARGARLLTGFFQPNFTSRWTDIAQGMQESLTMTVTSTVVALAPHETCRRCRSICSAALSLQYRGRSRK
jgi:phosphonate transport system permease protein